jgi:two-component system response regulator AtoC
LRTIESAAQYQTQPFAAGPKLVDANPLPFNYPVGVSSVWRKLLMQAEMAAPHVQFAAIEGEHGTGKQTLARYLHSRSPLARAIFRRHDAREWLARSQDPATLGGFIYLDRVDLLAAPEQALLLSVLKVLSDSPPGRAVLVVSSQTPLRPMAVQGLMLQDLAFRLTAIRFSIPPLCQRREDIAVLAQELLERICMRYQHRPVALGPGTLARLLQHSWPGNVRELASVLESALLESSDGMIRPCDLSLPVAAEVQMKTGLADHPQDLALDAAVRHHVQYVLSLNRGNKLRAARQLGISRSTLYRILGDKACQLL